jgi:hypothetical protein
MSDLGDLPGGEATAYRQGWRAGLALGALAMAVTAFINLFGFEKPILAIVLGLVALRGAMPGPARGRARLAIAIAAAHALLLIALIILFHDKLARLFALLLPLLQNLG